MIAIAIYAEIVYLYTQPFPTRDRLILAGTAWIGAFSHLVLDEIYSVDFSGNQIRVKRSFGTALKLWDRKSPYTSTLAFVAMCGLAYVCLHF